MQTETGINLINEVQQCTLIKLWKIPPIFPFVIRDFTALVSHVSPFLVWLTLKKHFRNGSFWALLYQSGLGNGADRSCELWGGSKQASRIELVGTPLLTTIAAAGLIGRFAAIDAFCHKTCRASQHFMRQFCLSLSIPQLPMGFLFRWRALLRLLLVRVRGWKGGGTF